MRVQIALSLLLCLCVHPTLQQEDEPEVAENNEAVTTPAPVVEEDVEGPAEEDMAEEEEAEEGLVKVRTILGTVTGLRTKTEAGDTVYKYLGIPYAQPPVGELRFKPPQPVVAFDDLNATQLGAECLQILDYQFLTEEEPVYSEDCLFLNVFSGVNPRLRSRDLRPVMFFIHGGGFIIGSANAYNPLPLLKEDVVVVTINYRLGPFGFLSFENDLVSGNQGLRDQILALEWTKQNIKYFGGDPDKIVIFGESAGSISVNALQLSPKVDGLISGAIMHSGNMLMKKAGYKEQRQEAGIAYLAAQFNCSTRLPNQELLTCLQEADGNEMLALTKSSMTGPAEEAAEKELEFGWWPCLDDFSSDPVLPTEPLQALKNGQFVKVPTITGTVLNDGGLMLFTEEEFTNGWNIFAPMILQLTAAMNRSEYTDQEVSVSNIVRQYYMGDSSDPLAEATLQPFIDMINDAMFLSPDQKIAEFMSPHVPVYNYRLSFKGDQTLYPVFLSSKNLSEEITARIIDTAPTHGDDLLHVFDLTGMPARNEDETAMSELMVKYWANFAKYGHPNHLMEEDLTLWKAFYPNNKRYLDLKLEAEMKTDVEPERMMFWDNMIWNSREEKVEREAFMLKLIHQLLKSTGLNSMGIKHF